MDANYHPKARDVYTNQRVFKPGNICRLNYRLSTACHETIMEKCANACSSVSIEQPCGGTVLQCLSDKIDEIGSEDCKKEVFYFQKMEVRDFRNDVILAETCRADVDQYCSTVEAGGLCCFPQAATPSPECCLSPCGDCRFSWESCCSGFVACTGEGRVHKCLWDNKDKISAACQKEERKIQIMQSSNTELMPNLAKACKSERAAHCKGVRPGKSRVYNCLVSNSDSVSTLHAGPLGCIVNIEHPFKVLYVVYQHLFPGYLWLRHAAHICRLCRWTSQMPARTN